MKQEQLLERLEKAWATLQESYTGLSDPQLIEPGVMGDWSVKDILAHVTSLRGGGALVFTADPKLRQATTIHPVWRH